MTLAYLGINEKKAWPLCMSVTMRWGEEEEEVGVACVTVSLSKEKKIEGVAPLYISLSE